MSEPIDGGPAFPRAGTAYGDHVQPDYPENGMSLRDYFAAKAMKASNALMLAQIDAGTLSDADTAKPADYIARLSYEYADAMLAARKP